MFVTEYAIQDHHGSNPYGRDSYAREQPFGR